MKTVIIALPAIISTLVLSQGVEARTVLGAKARCFFYDSSPGGWGEVFKIKPQQALTNKPGAMIETIGLIHGSKATNPELSYYDQLAGAASYIPMGNSPVNDTVQIALVGTSYGTDTGSPSGIYGLYSLEYSLLLNPQVNGQISQGKLVGVKRFKPIGNGHDADPPSETLIDTTVTETSCKDF